MKYHISATSRLSRLVLVFLLSTVPVVVAQDLKDQHDSRPGVQTPNKAKDSEDTGVAANTRMLASGQKAKVKGSIVRRDPDTFTVRDDQNMETIVLLTDRTSVKSKGGFFRTGTNYDVTSLLRGLPVEVEGMGNRDGQLVADKVRFDKSDLKFAKLVDTRVTPVEEANKRLSGQVDELGEVSRAAREEAGRAHDRISSLDDYEVQGSANVYFRTNSYVISPDDRRALDELASKASSIKGYVIEISGYADSTGNVERNRVLSQQRADAVVRYLQENHDIPLRRMVTPFGYGQLRPAADNGTAEGRRQNRRVEVKILVNRGISASRG
ncbi:MAG TPA: OmpA family protein [Blastocatellia bacterium]|nr:OmpA family protein [Blastocatellia bacterium]